MHSVVLSLVLLAAPIATQNFDAQIASSKIHHPETFTRVSSIVSKASELDQKKRGRFAPMTPMFRALGSDAGPALIEPLVHPERFTIPSEESARISLRAGLIEAAGSLADPANASLWRSILDSATEFYEVRAAAEALGRVANESDVATLISLAKTKGPKQVAVANGIASCRRADVARALGDLVAQNPDAQLTSTIARSLGRLGSSWAPDASTPKIAAVRAEAAKQAISVFLYAKDDARTAASDAVMAIDSPDTPTLIGAARSGASPEQNKALDDLQSRFAHNPVR